MHEQMNIYETNENYQFMLGGVFDPKRRPGHITVGQASGVITQANRNRKKRKETERN